MNQREREAVATLVCVALLMAVGLICWLQQAMSSSLWFAGAISLGYGLFVALTHDTARRRGCVYDERDALIEGRAWRAALNAAVFGFGLYVAIIVFVCGRSGDRWGEVNIPLLTLPAGLFILMGAASVTWAIETLRQTRFVRRANADREPSS